MEASASDAIVAENVLADRLGFDFVLSLEEKHPNFRRFKVTKKCDTNYVAHIDLQLLRDHDVVFRFLEDEVTDGNKDFLSDKGLFLYVVVNIYPQERPGFIMLTNIAFCTILSGLASIRAKSNKGSHIKPENVAKQEATRNTDIIWQFNERIDKFCDCLSKYFLIRQDKGTGSWTLENPILGDCMKQYNQGVLSHVIHKLTPPTKPSLRAKATDTTSASKNKKQTKVGAQKAPSTERHDEGIQTQQYVPMDAMEYSSLNDGTDPTNPHLNMILPSTPQQVVPMMPYPHNHPPYQNFMINTPFQDNNVEVPPMSQIERDTGVPDYVWKLIEDKARDDPQILIRMIDTLIPMRNQVVAMQQQGKDPRTLFVRSDELKQRK